MFRNIIWDVDGTLFDTYPAIAGAFHAALRDLGREAASLAWIEGLARESLGHCVSVLADAYRLDTGEIERAFGARYDRVKPEAQPPFPGVIMICASIVDHGGKNVIVTHRGRAGTAALLAAHGMTAYFSGCLARDDGYPKKPDPAAFAAALKTYDLRREETMAVGDREIDALAGRAAGLRTCLFGGARETAADLTVGGYDALYRYLVTENGDG